MPPKKRGPKKRKSGSNDPSQNAVFSSTIFGQSNDQVSNIDDVLNTQNLNNTNYVPSQQQLQSTQSFQQPQNFQNPYNYGYENNNENSLGNYNNNNIHNTNNAPYSPPPAFFPSQQQLGNPTSQYSSENHLVLSGVGKYIIDVFQSGCLHDQVSFSQFFLKIEHHS